MKRLLLHTINKINSRILFNRSLPYTYSWRKVMIIGAITTFFVVSILLFLQPFDTYTYKSAYKNMLLSGYGVCTLLPIVLVHVLENKWYTRRNCQWKFFNEVLVICLIVSLTLLFAYTYNATVIKEEYPTAKELLIWVLKFGVPFLPVYVPLLVYLRFVFGSIVIPKQAQKHESKLVITGQNENERLVLKYDDFILGKAQQNYVEVQYLQGEAVKRTVLRTTLARLSEQVPLAWQVHRSFLVNLNFVEDIEGNSRQRKIIIKGLGTEVPLSQKYYDSLKHYLQNRP